MLDVRVYRAAFIPALVALFVVAFSLTDRPAGVSSPLSADAFDGARAYGPSDPPRRDSLRELAAAYPHRRSGSPGDRALAARVAGVFRANGLRVQIGTQHGRTADGPADLETVVGVRPGLSSRRIVVMAHRDALSSPALAELSATAALIELARVFKVRDLSATLVLVSTSGASGGADGGRDFAEKAAGPVDALLVLGDLAGTGVRKPWVVPWSNGGRMAPLGLRRTVERAVRQEVGAQAGGPRAIGQWARRAVPLTVSAQGEPAAAGLPAVLLGVSGERGPASGQPVEQSILQQFGRAALRAATALDTAAADGDGAFASEPEGIVTLRRLLPSWSVRLLMATLLLPALLAAIDAFFRARRRRLPMGRWLAWTAALAVPFALALAWTRLLGLTGAVTAPPAPVLPGTVPLQGTAIAALASVPLLLVLAWLTLRPALVRALGLGRSPTSEGAAAALGLVLSVLVALVWVANPYAAALLLPAAHVWLFAAAPSARGRRSPRVVAVAAGLALPALVAVSYALALGIGPLGLAWLGFLAASGGHVSPAAALSLAAFGGCLAGVVAVARTRRRVAAGTAPDPIVTRGPAGYAGPGSLGGTESALRR
ncbi:MAG TPA: hypothetical protein VES79_10465 [Solirubrobacteraceae bacterium]|nr:hypothetical protein [Solirubrobacteraceae bacterium]